MNKIKIINLIIGLLRFQSYLEIGYDEGICFSNIQCKSKLAIDPYPKKIINNLLVCTSDEFFAKEEGNNFDMILIDGLHHREQVLRDIENSIARLNCNGVILCHDTMPVEEVHQLVPQQSEIWTGDVWKAIYDLRTTRNDLSIFTLDCDWGCTIITKGNQELLVEQGTALDWNYFQENKNNLLNVKPIGYIFDFIKSKKS
jgi:hypothetical protein